MRSLMTSLFALVCLCTVAMSADKADPAKPAEIGKPAWLNNVYSMDATGKQMALCGCTKEFEVTNKELSVVVPGTTMYCCSKECHEHVKAASKEDTEKMLAAWAPKYESKWTHPVTNVKEAKPGEKKLAVCGCGKEFELSAASPVVTENGVMAYCCSEACHEHFMSLAPDARKTEELKLVKGEWIKKPEEATKD